MKIGYVIMSMINDYMNIADDTLYLSKENAENAKRKLESDPWNQDYYYYLHELILE